MSAKCWRCNGPLDPRQDDVLMTCTECGRRWPATSADAATLREHAAEMAQALDDLLVWAEWIKAHIHRAPRMNEPNTGARLQANQTLTRWREGPGREKGGG